MTEPITLDSVQQTTIKAIEASARQLQGQLAELQQAMNYYKAEWGGNEEYVFQSRNGEIVLVKKED